MMSNKVEDDEGIWVDPENLISPYFFLMLLNSLFKYFSKERITVVMPIINRYMDINLTHENIYDMNEINQPYNKEVEEILGEVFEFESYTQTAESDFMFIIKILNNNIDTDQKEFTFYLITLSLMLKEESVFKRHVTNLILYSAELEFNLIDLIPHEYTHLHKYVYYAWGYKNI